jgi:hypothetical protein
MVKGETVVDEVLTNVQVMCRLWHILVGTEAWRGKWGVMRLRGGIVYCGLVRMIRTNHNTVQV